MSHPCNNVIPFGGKIPLIKTEIESDGSQLSIKQLVCSLRSWYFGELVLVLYQRLSVSKYRSENPVQLWLRYILDLFQAFY